MVKESTWDADRDALILISTAFMHLIRNIGDEDGHGPAKTACELECITALPGLDGETQAMIRNMAARCRELDGGLPVLGGKLSRADGRQVALRGETALGARRSTPIWLPG